MLWLIPLFPAVAGLLLLFWGTKRRACLGVTSGIVLAISVALAVLAAASGWTGSLRWSETLRLSVELMPVSSAMAILVPAIALPISVYAASHEHGGLVRLASLLLVFTGGMELLVVSADFVTLLIGWELVGACSWALIGHHWHDSANMRSANYAFLMTRFGDLGLFLAAIATYAGTGSFAFSGLDSLSTTMLALVAGGVLLSAAAKSGQIPFSTWLFRAMDGPTSVSALLHAATMVAAGAYLVARLHEPLSHVAWFGPATILLGLLTAIFGGIVALLQSHAKKLLAASTSAHFGLMFVAVGAGYPTVALLHLIAHACFKAPLFLAAGIAGERAGSLDLAQMRFGRALPLTAAMAGVAALALAGVPPLGGGFTKEAIVSAAGHRNVAYAVAVMVAGGLSAAYATRFQYLAFGSSQMGGIERPVRSQILALGYLVTASVLLSVLWIPSAKHALLSLLEGEAATSKMWELATSFAFIAFGLLGGWLLATKWPVLGDTPRQAAAADWLGLPALIRAWVTQPLGKGAQGAARLDDAVIDGAVRQTVVLARGFTGGIAAGDNRVVDGGVRLSARLGEWIADAISRFGEFVADGIPESSAFLLGRSGRYVRLIQTGLSHHYYAVISATSLLFILFVLLGT